MCRRPEGKMWFLRVHGVGIIANDLAE